MLALSRFSYHPPEIKIDGGRPLTAFKLLLITSAFLLLSSVALAQAPADASTTFTKQPFSNPKVSRKPATEPEASTAAAPAVGTDNWNFEISPYAWASALEGDLRIRNTTATVDASFKDLFKKLDFVAAVRLEATKKRWGIQVDENYMNLGESGRGPLGQPTDVQPTLNFLEGSVSYAPLIRKNKDDASLPPVLTVEFLAGARYTHFGLGLQRGTDPAVEGSRNLLDGFVGNRIKARPHPKFTLIGKYTLGGGGSHFFWTFTGLGDFKFHKRISLWGGYQLYDIDADKPSNTLGFNGQLKGLIFGLSLYR